MLNTVAIDDVTRNGTGSTASAVTCNAARCEPRSEFSRHCGTCHASDHRACTTCGECMPSGHRLNRWYCSSTCRVRAMKDRRLNPTEPVRFAKLEAAIAASLPHNSPDERSRRRERHALREASRRTGQTCALCGVELGDAIYRRRIDTGQLLNLEGGGRTQEVSALVCANCRCSCRGDGGLCPKCWRGRDDWEYVPFWGSQRRQRWLCSDAGPAHRGEFCLDCHPSRWVTGRCPGCERVILAVPNGNMRRAADGFIRVFCSARCRSTVARIDALAKLDLGPRLCTFCGEVMDGHRSDARYCSSACRQKAYRSRTLMDREVDR